MSKRSAGDAVITDEGGWVILIDDHELTRSCLGDILRRASFHVLELGCVDEGVMERLDGRSCRMVLLNIKAAGLHDDRVRALMSRISDMFPSAALAVLAARDGMEPALDAVRHGLRGYLSASVTAGELVAATRLIMAGGIFIAPCDSHEVLDGRPAKVASPAVPEPDEPEAPVETAAVLTVREAEVLALLRQGKSNKIIAYELRMAENTVKVHVRRILKKLKAANRTQAAFAAAPAPSAKLKGDGL